MSGRKTPRGVPLFEHVAVFVLAALLIGGCVGYALRVMEQAEASVVETTVMNIRSGLRAEKALRMLDGRAPVAAHGNPARFLLVPPAGYLEEDKLPAHIEPGTWFFTARTETLYYVPKRHTYLQVTKVPADEAARVTHGTLIGWKLAPQAGAAKEAVVVTVTPYRWF